MQDDYYGDAIEFGYPEDLRSDDTRLHNREDSRPISDDFYDLEGDLGKYMRVNTGNSHFNRRRLFSIPSRDGNDA